MTGWVFACPDWEQRLREGRSLIPDLPLFKDKADRAVRIVDKLCVPDIEGQPPFAVAAGEWFRDIVRVVFGSLDDEGVRHVPEVFALVGSRGKLRDLLASKSCDMASSVSLLQRILPRTIRMPDVLSSVVLLGVFLLAFCADQLRRGELFYVAALTTASITAHFSHVPIALGLILLCLGLKVILGPVRPDRWAAPLLIALSPPISPHARTTHNRPSDKPVSNKTRPAPHRSISLHWPRD